MVSDIILTEADVYGRRKYQDVVGLANYMPDSHYVRRFEKFGEVCQEGTMEMPRYLLPWGVSYRSMTPKQNEAGNVLTPWSISSTKIAFSSTRMEPCFMVLGQSAAIAASIAIDQKSDVQDIQYSDLRENLEDKGQILYSDYVCNSARRRHYY